MRRKWIKYLCALCFMTEVGSMALAQSAEEIQAVKRLQESLVFEKITPAKILEDFKKGGLQDVHPRSIASRADIERIKKLLADKDPLMQRTWEGLQKTAENYLTSPLPDGSLDGANLRVMGTHRSVDIATSLVIAWWITGEEKFAKRAYEVFENLCTYPDWGIATEPPYKDRHYLDPAMGAFVGSLIYDGLYDYLSQKERDYIYEQTSKYVFIPTLAQYDGTVKQQWWVTAKNNWNGICNGCVSLSALTFMERNPEMMSQLAAYGINNLAPYLLEFEPDGQSEEGMGYWEYGLTYTLSSLDAMQRILKTTYGRGETPGLRKAGYFPLLVTGPVVTLNVGDDAMKRGKSLSFFWFAKHFQDASIARLQYNLLETSGGKMSWFDTLCYEPELVQKGKLSDLPLDQHAYGLEISSLLEKHSDPNALFVVMHGGYNGANHGHLDAGSFYIQALGEIWAYGCLDGDNYTYPGYFKRTIPGYWDRPEQPKTAGQWHFYRTRTEGKNCLVFNPDVRPEQNTSGRAAFVAKTSTPEYSSFTVDLGDCYSRDLTRYTRTISLDRSKRLISVEDDFAAKTNSLVWWGMHTRAAIKIDNSGRRAVLEQKGKEMHVELVGAEDARFEVLPPTYLPGHEFPLMKNNENKGFYKLAFRLDQCKEGKFHVNFTFKNK